LDNLDKQFLSWIKSNLLLFNHLQIFFLLLLQTKLEKYTYKWETSFLFNIKVRLKSKYEKEQQNKKKFTQS
jgi:hypothetical protein